MLIFTLTIGDIKLTFGRKSEHHVVEVDITNLKTNEGLDFTLDNQDLKQLGRVIDLLDSY